MPIRFRGTKVNAALLNLAIMDGEVVVEPAVDINMLKTELAKLGVSIEDVEDIPCG